MFSEFSVDTCQCDMLTSMLNLLIFHFLPFYKLFSNLILDVPVLYVTNYKHTLHLAVYMPFLRLQWKQEAYEESRYAPFLMEDLPLNIVLNNPPYILQIMLWVCITVS